jgi:hypothetical protein
MLFTKLHAFFNPELFQGWGKKRNYFEGWYFKIISSNRENAFAFIPGVAMEKNGIGHSFIQVLNGIKKTSAYHSFQLQDFIADKKKLLIRLDKNSFSENHIQLNLPGIKGNLHFTGNVPWPKPFYSPGIMGPYAFAPFMECYHGIVSMDHQIEGSLEINDEYIDFSGGRGYTEKDWGRSFPSAYFWMQSNHFSLPGISLKCSVAKIPWIRNSFTGFIAGLWLNDRLYRFTTYNNTKLRRSFADEKKVEIVLENKKYLLEILAHRDNATALASPINGFMNGRIEESMTATLEIKLTDKKTKKLLLNDMGKNAGLEVAGKIQEIMI